MGFLIMTVRMGEDMIGFSELWGAGCSIGSLDFFVVGGIGLSFIDCEDWVVLTLRVNSANFQKLWLVATRTSDQWPRKPR